MAVILLFNRCLVNDSVILLFSLFFSKCLATQSMYRKLSWWLLYWHMSVNHVQSTGDGLTIHQYRGEQLYQSSPATMRHFPHGQRTHTRDNFYASTVPLYISQVLLKLCTSTPLHFIWKYCSLHTTTLKCITQMHHDVKWFQTFGACDLLQSVS